MPTQDWSQISGPNHYPDEYTTCQLLYSQTSTRTDTESQCSSHAQHSRRHIWKVKMASAATPRTTMSIFSLSPLRDTPNRTRRMTEVYCPEKNSILTVFLSHAFTISPKFSAHGTGAFLKLENVFKTGDRIYINENCLVSLIKFVQSTHYWSPNVHSLTWKTKEKWHKFSLKCMQIKYYFQLRPVQFGGKNRKDIFQCILAETWTNRCHWFSWMKMIKFELIFYWSLLLWWLSLLTHPYISLFFRLWP